MTPLCTRCDAPGPRFTNAAICEDCRNEAADQRIAMYRHPSNYLIPPHKGRRRKMRTLWSIDFRNPDHAAPGEEI